MSHVGNGEDDFKDLDMLDEETKEKVKQVRIEARDIIDRLEPRHITSWADLLFNLEDSLATARYNAELLDPVFRERKRQRLIEEEAKKYEMLVGKRSWVIFWFLSGVLLIAYLTLTAIGIRFNLLPGNIAVKLIWSVIIPIAIFVVTFPVSKRIIRWIMARTSEGIHEIADSRR